MGSQQNRTDITGLLRDLRNWNKILECVWPGTEGQQTQGGWNWKVQQKVHVTCKEGPGADRLWDQWEQTKGLPEGQSNPLMAQNSAATGEAHERQGTNQALLVTIPLPGAQCLPTSTLLT